MIRETNVNFLLKLERIYLFIPNRWIGSTIVVYLVLFRLLVFKRVHCPNRFNIARHTRFRLFAGAKWSFFAFPCGEPPATILIKKSIAGTEMADSFIVI